MDYSVNGSDILLHQPDFDLDETLDCGQAFRWVRTAPDTYEGYYLNSFLRISAENKADGVFRLHNTSERELLDKWYDYLDLSTDYGELKRRFSQDETLAKACAFAGGIRILRQDSWEALSSFIISQNNNIPRIKSLVGAVCRNYGEKFEYGGREYYAFPTPEALLSAGEDGLKALKTGFRASYLISAAEHVRDGMDLQRIRDEYTYEQGLEELCKIRGVGPKVASCTLLFALGKTDAFPIDVWIKKTIDKYFGGSLDVSSLGKYAGVAQQYLFYYERSLQ